MQSKEKNTVHSCGVVYSLYIEVDLLMWNCIYIECIYFCLLHVHRDAFLRIES